MKITASSPTPKGVPIRFDEVVPVVDENGNKIGTARIDGHVEDLLSFTVELDDDSTIAKSFDTGSYSLGFRPGQESLGEDCAYRPFEATYIPPSP